MTSEGRRIDRRYFLKTTGAAVAAAGLGCSQMDGTIRDYHPAGRPGTVQLKKALGFGMIDEKGLSVLDKFKLARDVGFDGVEMPSPTDMATDQIVAASEQSGLVVHGVMNGLHWKKPLSHPDPAVRAECVESIRTCLQDAKAWGGTSVLLVPAKVDETMPYDLAYERSQAEIRKVVPLAEKLGVRILIENVWNNFLLSPLEMARYVDEFRSPAVGCYFDVGNIVRSGWPEQWIRILGGRIGKIHVKEYSRSKRDNEGLWKGFQVEIGEGDCNWPEVMKALREIGFSGWATAEVPGGDRQRLADIAQRMDRVFAM